jgi:hypothetical protein
MALNVGLVATFFYFMLQKKETSVVFELSPIEKNQEVLVSHLSNEELLNTYSTLSFQELGAMLEDSTLVEEGYRKRDLALASLVAFHFFNLEKALSSSPPQKRQLSFIHQDGQEKVDIMVFPGISDEQFQALIQYVKSERWPLTAQGIFFELKDDINKQDVTLLETFYLTSEFRVIEALFTRSGFLFPREFLVWLLTQGEWKMIADFTEEQKLAQDLSSLKLKNFLLGYVKKRSLPAAKILLEWDREFVAKKLEDFDLVLFLDLFPQPTPSLSLLLKELLCSQRSDAIWRKSAEKLYTFHHLPLPEAYNYELVLQTFFPETARLKKEPSAVVEPAPLHKRIYTVQHGDNLWKIAKKHKVSVEALRKQNKLTTDKLRPGKELEIP